MRILFLALDVDPTSPSGEFVHLSSVALSWDKQGHDVSVILPAVKGAKSAIEPLFRKSGVQFFLNDARNDISTISFCMGIVKRTSPDIIYERRFSPKIGVVLKALSAIPFAVEINGLIEDEAAFRDRMAPMKELTSSARRKLRSFLFESCDLIVVVAEGIKDVLVGEYGVEAERISVVHNGADVHLFRPKSESAAKKAAGLREEDVLVCYVGSMQPWHALGGMTRALRLLSDEFPHLKLLIVGEGMMKTELEKLAVDLNVEDRVVFVGHIPHSAVPDYINSSILCLAFFRESRSGYSSLKLYEYLACERPVIASANRGHEFLEREGCGITLSSPDPEEIANAVRTLTKSTRLRIQMGKKGREFVVREHSWESISESLIRKFRDVIASG